MPPPTASQEVDCAAGSGYASGPVPDTCTVQLPLNDTEAAIVGTECEDFPHKCRLRKFPPHLLVH